jgi:hypothetical protein
MLSYAEDVEPDLIGQLDLLEQVPQSLSGAHLVPVSGDCRLCERIESDFHR